MAKKVKGLKAAKVALPRPLISPYTSPLVTLNFGPDHKTYYLPEVLLQRLENIPSLDPWTREINLVDVDASIGHVLIHFLHTGVYQTLDNESIEESDNNTVRNEFQKAMLALEAAEKYNVRGLKELAQIEVERRGKDMSLRDAVRAIQEPLIAGPSDNHTWIREYVIKKVRWTFEHDPSTLSAPDFFESIESPTLARLLAQIIVGLYSEKVEKLCEERKVAGQALTSERGEPPGLYSPDLQTSPTKHFVMSSNAWPASIEKFGAFDDSSAAWDPDNLGQDQSSSLEASTPPASTSFDQEKSKEEVLHTVAEHAETITEAEPTMLEINPFAGLKKSQVKKLKAKLDKEAKLKVKEDTKRQEEEEAVKMLRQGEEEAEQIRLEDERKKIEEEVALAATEVEECKKREDDIWGDWGRAASTVGKKKTRRSEQIRLKEERAECIRLEEEQRIRLEEEQRIRLEEEQRIRLEEEQRIRLEEEQRIHLEEEEAAAAEAEKTSNKEKTPWSTWGNALSKNEKGKKVERALVQEEEREIVDTAVGANVSVFSSVIETSATSNDDDCEMRLWHLSRNDGWQNCKPCELYMRRIAIKVHSAELPNVDGVSTIN